MMMRTWKLPFVVLLMAMACIAFAALEKVASAQDAIFLARGMASARTGVVTGKPAEPLVHNSETIAALGLKSPVPGYHVVFVAPGRPPAVLDIYTELPIGPGTRLTYTDPIQRPAPNPEWGEESLIDGEFYLYTDVVVNQKGNAGIALFSTSAPATEDHEAVLTGNSDPELGIHEVVFVKKGEQAVKAEIVSLAPLLKADRVVGLVTVETDPESGETTFAGIIEE